MIITNMLNGLLTMRSIVHAGFVASGWMLTQLSNATPKFEPPHMRIVTGSVYGACCGSITAAPSLGYVRPARKLVTDPGILGNTSTVCRLTGSKMRASL